MKHELILDDLSRFNLGRGWRARCTCRLWESAAHQSRPDAIRAHTWHVSSAAVIYA